MSQFSLITNLNEESKKPETDHSSTHNITYQQYDLDIDNKEVGVLVPVRECDNFETILQNIEKLTNYKLKKILREHRGIFVRDNKV